MTKKVKLALMANENSRAASLKKRRSALEKKVKELSILCDVKACLIMFTPKEAEPMVWPSAEATSDLLNEFYALPAFKRKKNETSLESYLKEKTRKAHENLMKTQKENMEYKRHQLMMQPSCLRKLDDLDMNEIYSLMSLSRDEIMRLRKRLGYIQHPPLRDPPVLPFEEQVNEFRTNTDDVNMVSIGTLKETQTYYLMDEWIFPSPKQPSPETHQQIMMNMASNNNNTPDPRCYHPYQGSSSNGDNNLEMEPTFPPVSPFPNFIGPVSSPYPLDLMSHEERSNINNSNDIDDRQVPPPSASGATPEEGNVGAKSFAMNMD